jgi:hypothetical protein
MTDVSFRFYAQLNDFLPAGRRGRRFTRVVDGVATVKDTIEALGVPHPKSTSSSSMERLKTSHIACGTVMTCRCFRRFGR